MGRDKTVGLRADEGLVYRREPHLHFPDDQLLITRIGDELVARLGRETSIIDSKRG